MFFTKAGRVVAVIALTLGALQFALGLGVATGAIIEPNPGAVLGSKTSGQAIDRGIYTVLFAIVIGILTDISNSVAQMRAKP